MTVCQPFQGSPLTPQEGCEHFDAVHADQQVPRILTQSPVRHDVFIDQTQDGPDLILVCARHQFAALPVIAYELIGSCPFCSVEDDARRGKARYAALQSAVIRGVV